MRVIGMHKDDIVKTLSSWDYNGQSTIKELGRNEDTIGLRIGWVEQDYSYRKEEYVEYKKAAWLLFKNDICVGSKKTKREILNALGVNTNPRNNNPLRAIHSPKAKSFDDNLKLHPLFRTDRGNCGVRAFANITQKDYATSREQCMKHGYKPMGGGMYTHRLKVAFKEFGIEFEDCTASVLKDAKTIKTFERANIKGRWLLVTSGHFVSVVDGTVTDWSAERNLRIKTAYRMIEK